MNPAVEFLNHGILPFTGREIETERLIRFCTGGFDNREMRLLLLSGEAGVGKSRLLEETVERLPDHGVVPVHIRVYPDTAVSILSLLAAGLNRSAALRRLLREDVRPGLGPVLNALRRLARLRLIALIIEDIHLLSGEHLGEFTSLCSALFNESITVVAAARPLGADVRSAVDTYLVDEIVLRGFDRGSMEMLWQAVVGSPLTKDLADDLDAATAGNPLAVRSALRGAFRNGLVDIRGFSLAGERHSRSSFAEIFRQGAVRFGEGLAVHLAPEERESLAALSWLGEVLSHEAAAALLGDRSTAILEALRFKGMLAESNGATEPVQVVRSETSLLVFTHSLVHRQFLESSEPDVDRLVWLLATHAPLYSRVPIELVAERIDDCTLPAETIGRAMEQIRHVAAYADHGLGWRGALEIHGVAERLFERWSERFDPADREYWRAWLTVHRAGFSRRYADLLPELISRGSEMTAGRDGERWLALRLIALHYACMIDDSEANIRVVLDEVKAIVRRYPPLRDRQGFVQAMRFIALRVAGVDGWDLLREVEKEVDNDPGEREHRWGYNHMLACLCLAYDTPEEFRRREAMFSRLDTPGAWRDVRGLYPMTRWLFDAGYHRRLLEVLDGAIELYGMHRARSYVALNSGVKVLAGYLTGVSGAHPVGEFDRISFEPTDPDGEERRYLLTHLTDFALMCGDNALADRVRERALRRIAHGVLLDDDLQSCLDTVDSGEEPERRYEERGPLLPLVRSVLSNDGEAIASAFDDALAMHVLRIDDPPELMAVLHLADRIGLPNDEARLPRVREAIERLLRYFAEPARSMNRPLRAILDRFGSTLRKRDAVEWKRRLREMESEASETRRPEPESEEKRIRLRMIGDIALLAPGESEYRRVRGERLCACIGALVAERVLRREPDQREFRRLATGESDPDRARKILKVALFRTRELLGSDAVLSDDEGIRLNTSCVSVDLLEMVGDLDMADSSIAKGLLARAVRYIGNAVETFGGEVMFPTLYDSVFEAIRDELEARIRNLLVRLVRRLLDENDPSAAEALLRKSLDAMPEDEELYELLRDTLLVQGHLAEAELVRIGQEPDGGED